jgi:hypothetical protein
LARVFLALVALVGLMWLASWLGKATPVQRSRALKLIVLYGVAGALLLLVVTGRIHWMFAIISAAVPWLQRLLVARQAWRLFKTTRGPSSGQTSRVETEVLRMTLDHDSGELNGEVISGPFAGRALGDLSKLQLLELLQECRSRDAQSAALLEAYLDRTQGDSWRNEDEAAGHTTPPQGSMSESQASEILGVTTDASRKEVIEAHRRLIQRLHTDRGGTDYLAALVNEARDTLTKSQSSS